MLPKEGDPSSEKAPLEEISTAGELDLEAADPETLRESFLEEKEKAEKYLANWQRAVADYANLKRRTEQEREELAKFANGGLITGLLPVIDDLERALDAVSPKIANHSWVEGIRLIYRKLLSILELQGVSRIEALGQDFDPNFHDAVIYEEGEEGKVVEEVGKGYKLHDRVLRPSMVKVGKRKEEEAEGQ